MKCWLNSLLIYPQKSLLLFFSALTYFVSWFKELSLLLFFCVLFLPTYTPAIAAEQTTASSPDITVSGAPEILEKNILDNLNLSNEACNSSTQRLARLQSEVVDAVQQSSRALGFYHSQVQAQFSSNLDCWQLAIAIQPGDRITLSEVNLTISSNLRQQESLKIALEETPLVVGAFLNHQYYEDLKKTISAAAIEQAYFGSRFTQSEIAVNTASNTASITLTFDEGPQYRIGQISVINNSQLNTEFIYRLMKTTESQPYSSEAMFELKENLTNSQYFSSVNITPNITNNSTEVPIQVTLVPRARHAFSSGIGFTTDTGPKLSTGYDNRLLNPRGHRLDTDMSFSEVRSEFNSSYQVPLSDPARQLLEFRFGALQEDNASFTSKVITVESNFRHEFHNGWLANLFINYQRDNYEVNLQSDNSTLTMLGTSLAKTRADNLIFPNKGWRLFGQVRGASESLFSDASFIQTEISSRYIQSINERFRLLLRLNGGSTWIKDELTLPASLRFFAGGDQSLRGYKYHTLGPLDDMDEVIGGKHLLSSSVEVDFRVHGKWRGAIFYDGGNAFSNFNNLDWKHSLGVGARWLSPIGPIRVDLAHPLQLGGIRIHISMGPDL